MLVNNTMFSVGSTFASTIKAQQQLQDLQRQLASGKAVDTLSDLGSERSLDIDLRQRLTRVESYQESITMASTRLDVVDVVLARLDEIEADARSFAQADTTGENGLNMTTAQDYAESYLDEVLNLLNTEVAGRYLFGGKDSDDMPVESLGAILDGDGGRDGFRTVVAERKAADAGADGMGRIGTTTVGPMVTLAEDGAHSFGFKLSAVSTDSGAVSTVSPVGDPASMSLTLTGVPDAGDKVYVTLDLPDGTNTTLELEAVAGTAEAGQFTIGADAAATAANFETALDDAILATAEVDLDAASTFAAADNFFNGNGDTVMRVDGPPFDTATAQVAATDADTVVWYDGSSGADARNSVKIRVGDSAEVGYGVEANETGMLELIRSLAAMTVETFPAGDDTAEDRYDAMTDRQVTRLSESRDNTPGSLEVITMQLGVARTTMNNYSERYDSYTVQLESMVSEIEDASIEEVAVQILALQTRLEASYQTLATVSQLSLVNYLG